VPAENVYYQPERNTPRFVGNLDIYYHYLCCFEVSRLSANTSTSSELILQESSQAF
jgi:hypothetical protein